MHELLPQVPNLIAGLLVLGALRPNPPAGTELGPCRLYHLAHPHGPAHGRLPTHQDYPLEHLDAAVETLLADAPAQSPVILYVHGRAAGEEEEPGKSLGGVVPPLEDENAARVLMFFWPGSAVGGPLGFPEDQARQAGPALGRILAGLDRHKQAHPDQWQDRRVVLLLHSMGNIVFEEYMLHHRHGSLSPRLFDTLVLSASATAAKHHADWLAKVDYAGQVYVTVNEDDPVLDKAGVHEHSARLGKKLHTLAAGDVGLAGNALYIDLGDTKADKHRYFLQTEQAKNPYLRRFFAAALSGRTLDLEGFEGIAKVERRDGTAIYHLKR